MPVAEDDNTPATKSLSYEVMAPRWEKILTLLGGTESMRNAGQKYLPKHPGETSQAYHNRLQVTTLLNMVDITLSSLTSKPFSDPIKKEEVPKEIDSLLDDVDLQGMSLDRFARSWFRDSLALAFSCVLVEFPRTTATGGMPRTLEDDNKEKPRPYFVQICPTRIIGGSVSVQNGVEVVTEIRYTEEVVERVGYKEVIKERIRELTPGMGRVYEKREDARKRVKWVQIEEYTYDLDFVPVVIDYSNREGFLRGKPDLTDLADLNIRHWQSTSDHITVLTVARFPILAVSGALDTDQLTIGPHSLLSCTDAAGRFYYVEHSGKAINNGRQDILDLEELMAEYGATLLKKRPGGATATARSLDSVETTSALQDRALGFEDSLNRAMWMMARWMKIEDAGKYTLKKDFGLSDKAEAGLTALKDARTLGDISRKEYLTGLMRYGVLPDTFPILENDKDLESEAEKNEEKEVRMLEATAKAKPAPAAGPPKK